MSPDVTHDDLLALVDELLTEVPTGAEDISAELLAIQSQHRGDRATERPGAPGEWNR